MKIIPLGLDDVDRNTLDEYRTAKHHLSKLLIWPRGSTSNSLSTLLLFCFYFFFFFLVAGHLLIFLPKFIVSPFLPSET